MIFTKKGDGGKSSTINRENIEKDDIVFDVLGGIDELAAHLGTVRAVCGNDISADIDNIQSNLIEAAAAIAGGKPFDFDAAAKNTEERILSYNPDELSNGKIIKFGGSECGARLDVARAVCRRAERSTVTLCRKERQFADAVVYFNRLSDLLFVISRFVEKEGGAK